MCTGSTKGPRRGGEGRGGGWLKRRRLVKRNRPSRLNIRGTHGGLASAAPLSK